MTLNRFNKLAIVFCGLLWGLAAYAQVPVALAPVAHQQFLDANGHPLAGGKVCTFSAGTTTPAATYTDINGITQNTNPIVLDSGGYATIYLASQGYKIAVYDGTGNSACPNSGVQQYVQDNVNAFQAVTGALNIIFAGVTSDPSGVAGQMDYRTDIPCFRSFTTVWDCFVRLNDVQTLTNKTLTAPTITGPTITGTVSGSPTILTPTITTPTINAITVTGAPATYFSLSNDGTTGTTLNTLTKMLGATAVIASTSDTGGIVGITTGNAGKAGLAAIQQNGAVSCAFDGSTVAGDYIQISSTIAGNCHDAGSAYPASGQVIGRVTATVAGAGTDGIVLFGPEFKQTAAARVDLATGANISSTPILTPSAPGFYRASCYLVINVAATTSSTLPACQILFTDADTSVVEPAISITATNTSNTVGTSSAAPGTNTIVFNAKGGVAISYATSGYASSGATSMSYAIHLRLEGPL